MATTKKTAKSRSSKSVPKTAAIWKSFRDAKLPDRGENVTYSLRLLLDYYSPGVLDSAIKKYGIHTRDRHGLSIHCTKADNTEQLERALALLADWQAELDDPGPEYSWDSERYYGGDHPTESWWLPDKVVKQLDEIRKSLNRPFSNTKADYWTQRTLKEFKKDIKHTLVAKRLLQSYMTSQDSGMARSITTRRKSHGQEKIDARGCAMGYSQLQPIAGY